MTSTLRLDTLRLPAAAPPVAGLLPILHGTKVRPGATGADAEMTAQIAYGQPYSLLPYTTQDGYDRAREERSLPVVVLENEHLTATFLPAYGGRLWSLVHRPSGRELLHRNPILQPANLALRDAWLAGGVEWNLGATGHWPLTCSPLHAVRLAAANGTPVLRMFEFERMRRLVMSLDAWLPPGSPVLFVRPSIRNASSGETPVYWWSNIAVPEAQDVRVVAPATQAHHFGYRDGLSLVDFPEVGGADRSYTTRAAAAADYFFEIPAGERRWIAALDASGSGLAQVSTDRLRGRKLFNWGTGPGGRRWQEWLSGPSARYLEIQAGLARTQLEHLPMPGETTWSWVEAYGLLEADPSMVHGSWDEARKSAAEALDRLIPRAVLDSALQDRPRSVDASGPLARGSGWGALETVTGGLPAEPPFGSPAATPFGSPGELPFGSPGELPFGAPGDEQRPWLELAATGRLPISDPPVAAITGPRWRELLEAHPADWHARYHLGLVRYADGDPDGAREAWQESLSLRRTPWVLRCLAHTQDLCRSDLYLEAHSLAPGLAELTIETLAALLADDRPDEALSLVDALDDTQRGVGRIRLQEAQAALAAGDLDRVAALLDGGIEVHNLKEGEVSLDSIWFAYQERRLAGTGPVTPEIAERARREHPLPEKYDFRMQA